MKKIAEVPLDYFRKQVSSKAGIHASAGRNADSQEEREEARAATSHDLEAAKLIYRVAKALDEFEPFNKETARTLEDLIHSRTLEDFS